MNEIINYFSTWAADDPAGLVLVFFGFAFCGVIAFSKKAREYFF